MAINISNSVASVKVEITADYSRTGFPTIPAQTCFIPKGILNVKAQGNDVVLFDRNNIYPFLYSDITTPSGATAVAVAALIEALLD